VRLGLVDDLLEQADPLADATSRALALATADDFTARLAARNARREADEAQKPLRSYREEELERRRLNFYGFDPSYHVARHRFMFRTPHSWTPRHLAVHRRL
jgi:putative two-component system hydrogenase maturation factor HypX/HoxX